MTFNEYLSTTWNMPILLASFWNTMYGFLTLKATRHTTMISKFELHKLLGNQDCRLFAQCWVFWFLSFQTLENARAGTLLMGRLVPELLTIPAITVCLRVLFQSNVTELWVWQGVFVTDCNYGDLVVGTGLGLCSGSRWCIHTEESWY